LKYEKFCGKREASINQSMNQSNGSFLVIRRQIPTETLKSTTTPDIYHCGGALSSTTP